MHTSKTRRIPSTRWLVALWLALAILPALASDASAQYRRGGGYNGRGYGGYAAPGYYSRGYSYGPRTYAAPAYGYAPRAYGLGNGFYNGGVPYRNAYRAPVVVPGYRSGYSGYPY